MGNMVAHKAVPPTPYYYGARAELHRKNALAALGRGEMETYLHQMQQYSKYTELGMQLRFALDTVYDNHMEEVIAQ